MKGVVCRSESELGRERNCSKVLFKQLDIMSRRENKKEDIQVHSYTVGKGRYVKACT